MDGDREVRDRVQEIDHRHKEPVNQNADKKLKDAGGPTRVCEFCGEKDPHFTESSKYEMHLWKECPVLVTCAYCA